MTPTKPARAERVDIAYQRECERLRAELAAYTVVDPQLGVPVGHFQCVGYYDGSDAACAALKPDAERWRAVERELRAWAEDNSSCCTTSADLALLDAYRAATEGGGGRE